MVLDKQFVFIIGAPRSGTSWLQAMIGAHPQICTTVELTLFSHYTGSWIQVWMKEAANIEEDRWHQGLPFLWTEDEFYHFLQEFLSRVYERVVATNPQATHVLDKHPGYSMYVEDMARLIPGAKFIHTLRDGRDVILSMIAARKKVGFGAGSVKSAAIAWKGNVQAAQKACQYGDQYLEVRYEDLSAAGIEMMKDVFDFCALPVDDEVVTAIVEAHQFEKMKAKKQTTDKRVVAKEGHYGQGKVGGWWKALRPKERYLFHKIAGDLLCELGYADESWWVERGYEQFTLPFLAAIPSFGEMRRRVKRAIAQLLGH